MKKAISIITLFILFVATSPAQTAAPYKHGIGFTLGNMQAISYKSFPKDHLSISLDLGTSYSMPIALKWDNGALWTADLKLNLMYEGKLADQLFGFAGGGIGFGSTLNFKQINVITLTNKYPFAKFAANAIIGLEYKLPIPLSLQIDARPGYSLLYTYNGDIHCFWDYFDWTVNISAKFTF